MLSPLIVILIIFFIVLFIFFSLWKLKSYQNQVNNDDIDRGGYEFISNLKVSDFKFDPNEDHLETLGESLIKANVKSIYLVHGTFVGEDPFHLIELIQNSFPRLGDEFIKLFKSRLKKGQDSFAKDLGNFIEEHKDILTSMTNGKIRITNFSWSSGNNHYARLKGAMDLITALSENHLKGDRILLIGHSHAGQIFALITQFLNDKVLRNKLIDLISNQENLYKSRLEKDLKLIKGLELDFVTLGAPPKYKWKLSDNMRLLHFINHRGITTKGGSLKGATFTKDGDYIQQWGIPGSDMKSLVKSEQLLNEKLDDILGIGSNFEYLREQIKNKNRFHNEGYHLLVDYGDGSKFPNFFQTILGHGVYTRIVHFKFLFHEICGKFYL